MNPHIQSKRASICNQIYPDINKVLIQKKPIERHKISIRQTINLRQQQLNLFRSGKNQDILHKSNTIPCVEATSPSSSQPYSNEKYFICISPYREVFPLTTLQNINLSNALYLTRELITKCMNFQQNYGFAYFQVQQWSLNADGCLVCNQVLFLNNKYKNMEEFVCIEKILQFIGRKACAQKVFDDFCSFYRRAKSKSKCDYKYTLSLIQSYSKCSKIHIHKHFDFNRNSNPKIESQKSICSPPKTTSIKYSKLSNNNRIQTVQDSQSDSLPKNSLHNAKSTQNRFLNSSKDIKDIKDVRIIKKSAQIQKKYKINQYLTHMTKSNQIPSQYMTNNNKYFCKEYYGDGENSSFASTENKTKSMKSCEKLNKKMAKIGRNLKTLNEQSISVKNPINDNNYKNSKYYYQKSPSFLEYNAIQVQSQSDQSDSGNKQQNQQHQQISNNIYKNNQWQKKIDNLLSTSSNKQQQILQSFIQGKQQYSSKMIANPENLAKRARVIVQSYINIDNNGSRVRED